MSPIILALLVNSIFLFSMLLSQCFGNLPTRGSLIPGTKQPFLYWQDFHCQKYGNAVGMPLMLATFIKVYANDQELHWWALYIGIGLLATIIFTIMCLSKDHKPDWGFPAKGKINLGGIIHLIYFWFYVSIISFTLFHWTKLTANDWSIFFAGLIIYAISWWKDVKSGNFDPLKLS